MQNLKSLLLNSRILLVLVLLALFAGCSDDDDKGSTGEPGTLERLFSYPTITSCGTCHAGGGSGPDMTKANFRNSLVGKKTTVSSWTDPLITQSTANCAEKYNLVEIGKPSQSSVLMAISQRHGNTSDCTSAINYHDGPGKASISGAALEDFELWIINGAKP